MGISHIRLDICWRSLRSSNCVEQNHLTQGWRLEFGVLIVDFEIIQNFGYRDDVKVAKTLVPVYFDDVPSYVLNACVRVKA